MKTNKLSYLHLLIGFILLFFSNGRWILPLATFLAPVFLIRFLRFQRALTGFLFLLALTWISNIFIWKYQVPASGLIYYIMTLMMGIFTSLVFIIDRIYSQRLNGIVSTLVLPSLYVFMEYITILTNPGGANGGIANTQSYLPLLQIISLTGICGVTFIIFWTASIINWLWDNSFEKPALRKALWVYLTPIVAIILFGQLRLTHDSFKDTVRIASINISREEIKHISGDHPDSINDQINKTFLENCHTAALSNAKIVFGIEIMLNMVSDKEAEYLEKAKYAAIKDRIYIGLPLLIYQKDKALAKPMNKITWISPQGKVLFTYFKAKPTPGEGSYGDGKLRYFDSSYGRISSAICFDMDFPSLIHQVHSKNIDIMLVPGNDWEDITPYHTYVASFRAIEQGFNLVRAASRGLSASFDYKGQIISSLNYFTSNDRIFYSDVPVKGHKTVYSSLGDYFAWICILYFAIISFVYFKNK